MEITQPLLPSSVALASKLEESGDIFYSSKEICVDLTTAIATLDGQNSTSQLFIDASMVGRSIIVKLSDEATLSIYMDCLINCLNLLHPTVIYDFSNAPCSSVPVTQSVTPVGRYIIPQRHIESFDQSDLKSVFHTLAAQQVNAAITADSLEILRHTTAAGIIQALTSTYSAVAQSHSAKSQIDETNKRLGPLTEQVVRSRLSIVEGQPWSESIRIRSLNELVIWVGKGIRATEGEIDIALTQIMDYVLKGFSGFERAKKYDGCPEFNKEQENEVSWNDVFPFIC